MNLEGLEMVAVLVVLVLFVKVLEQFGLFEPVSLEGNWSGRGPSGGFPPHQGHGHVGSPRAASRDAFRVLGCGVCLQLVGVSMGIWCPARST